MKTQIPLLIVLIFNLLFCSKGNGETLYISYESRQGALLTASEVKSLPETDINKIYSNKKLGSFVEQGRTYFRLFAPSAKKVTLVTFTHPEEVKGTESEMQPDSSGVWEASLAGEKYGLFYGFRVEKKEKKKHEEGVICLDPYARAVASFNTYLGARRAIVVKENNYDWQGDESIQKDWRDLIIYEMHIKDMTADPSSGVTEKGTYKGLTETGKKGGLSYIKKLGVNTVELLPAQEFANIEIPFHDSLAGRYNTWNPYERNHWGYMTAAFFAPEAYYSSKGDIQWNTWSGSDARQVNDFKDMVRAFHKEGIAVIMDVVYNHISEYELGNLKEIDSLYYFRMDEKGRYSAQSGCGNDFKTERPMARRMIVESVLFWMKEYHVDGFRFDLGKMLDWETIEEIIYEAKKVNPNVVIVCEPWGGGYDPAGFSLRGWGSWNDQIRNGIKGENPVNGQGWIFGKWQGNNDINRIKSYVNGTLVRDKFGLFQKKEHSVNYLESHDGYSLGDFIRISTGEAAPDKVIKDRDKNAALSPVQLKLNKLAALFLLTSQGITMLSEGQEFARSKVIPSDIKVKDHEKGRLDHNSYNKDNEVNYINYLYAAKNSDLVNYYRGLIRLRKKFEAFRRADYENITFQEPASGNHFALGYELKYEKDEFIVLFNASDSRVKFSLPAGQWNILVNGEKAGIKSLGAAGDKITISPKEGAVLKKKK